MRRCETLISARRIPTGRLHLLSISFPRSAFPTNPHLNCPNNHVLSWFSDIPFHYQKLNGEAHFTCHFCSGLRGGGSWHCRICSYDICEDCAAAHGCIRPKILCDKGHEAVWCPQITGLYSSEFGNKKAFKCARCQATKKEPDWNCLECKFDCCLRCGVDAVYRPPFNLLVCEQEHLLDHFILAEKELGNCSDCSACKTGINAKELYRCGLCEGYNVCLKCAQGRISRMVPHPVFLCLEGKALVFGDIKQNYKTRCSICTVDQMGKAYL